MGCDIHFHVEERDNGGLWRRAEALIPNRWYEPGDENDPDDPQQPLVHESWYHDRNYNLFAILADVRNGVGFAGVDTGDRLNPIAEPRGLPLDVSAELRASSDRWGVDGHSHSWFTIEELLAYDWDQVVVQRCLVSPGGPFGINRGRQRYRVDFDDGKCEWRDVPDDWPFGETADGDARTRGTEPNPFLPPSTQRQVAMDRIDTPAHEIATDFARYVRRYAAENGDLPYGISSCSGASGLHAGFMRQVEYEQAYRKAIGGNWWSCLQRMAHHAVVRCDGDLSRVRAVFWFDN